MSTPGITTVDELDEYALAGMRIAAAAGRAIATFRRGELLREQGQLRQRMEALEAAENERQERLGARQGTDADLTARQLFNEQVRELHYKWLDVCNELARGL